MTTDPNASPRAAARLLALACYLGLAPVIKLWRSRSSDSFLRHHLAQALAISFILQLWLLTAFVFNAGGAFILARSPEWDRRLDKPEFYFACGLFLLFILVVILWMVLVGLSLAGSSRQIPWFKRLTCKPWLIRYSLISNSLTLAAIPFVAAFAVYATSLTRTNREGASVYFLYDEGVWVPRWAFAMGLYRVVSQAERNWGKGCTVLDRLNTQTLRTALASGKVVILATHGEEGYAVTYFAPEYLCVGPPDRGAIDERGSARFLQTKVLGRNDKWSAWQNVTVGSQLRLAYIFACNSGTRDSQWQEHLAPAPVITYNRVSSAFDHAYWFAFAGPATLSKLR